MLVSLRHILSPLFFLSLCLASKAQTNYTLRQALQVARTGNPILKAEQFNIEIAQSDIISAGIRPNPVLNNQTLLLTRPFRFPESFGASDRQVWWQLTKTFQIAGQRGYKLDFARESASLSEKDYAETERALFYDVATKWMEVWAAQKQLDILTTAKSNMDSLLTSNLLRYKNQVITRTDLFRVELLSKQYAIQRETAARELVNSQNELSFLLGVDSAFVDTADHIFTIVPAEMDSLYKWALENRGDIQAAISLINLSNSNIKLQKALAYPQPELGAIWNPQNSVPYFGIYATVDLPLFNRNQGEIKKSYLLKDQAGQRLSAIQNQSRTEVENAYASYRTHRRNIENFEAVSEQAQTVLDNVRYAYLKGGTTIIDFLEAQRGWLETRRQYYEASRQYRQSYIQLLYATGLINQLAQ